MMDSDRDEDLVIISSDEDDSEELSPLEALSRLRERASNVDLTSPIGSPREDLSVLGGRSTFLELKRKLEEDQLKTKSENLVSSSWKTKDEDNKSLLLKKAQETAHHVPSKFEIKCQELCQQLQAKDETISQLKKTSNQHADNAEKYKALIDQEKEKFTKQAMNLAKMEEKLKATIKERDSHMALAERASVALQKQLEKEKTTCERLEANNQKLVDKLMIYETKLKDFEATKADLDKKINTLEASLASSKSLENDNSILRSEIESIKEKHKVELSQLEEKLNEQISVAEKDSINNQEQISDLQQSLVAANEKFSKLKLQFQHKLKALKEEKEKAQAEANANNEAFATVESLKNRIAELEEEKGAHILQTVDIDSEIENRMANLRQEFQALVAEKDENIRIMEAEARSKMASLEEDRDKSLARIEELLQYVKKCEDKLAMLGGEADGMQRKESYDDIPKYVHDRPAVAEVAPYDEADFNVEPQMVVAEFHQNFQQQPVPFTFDSEQDKSTYLAEIENLKENLSRVNQEYSKIKSELEQKVGALAEENIALKAQVNPDSARRIEELENRIAELEEEKGSHMLSAVAFDSNLEDQIAKLKYDYDTLVAEKDLEILNVRTEREENYNEVQLERAQYINKISELEESLRENASLYALAKSSETRMEEKIRELQLQMETDKLLYDNQLTECSAEIKSLKEVVEKEEEKFLKLKKQCQLKLKMWKDKYEEAVKSNENAAEIVNLQNRLAELEEEKGNLLLRLVDSDDQQVNQKLEEVKMMRNRIGELESENREMQTTIPQLHHEIGEKETELNYLKNRIGELEQENNRIQTTVIPQMQQHISQKDEELHVLQNQVSELGAENGEFQTTIIPQLKEQLTQKDDEVNILKSRNGDLETENKELQSTIIPQLKQQIVERSEEIRSLRSQLCDFENQYGDMQAASTSQLEEQMEQKEEEISTLKERINELESENGDMQATIPPLKKQLTHKDEEINVLKAQINDFESQIEKLQSTVVAQLEEKVIQKDEEIITLNAQLSHMQGRLNDIQTSWSQWEQQVCQKDEELRMLRTQASQVNELQSQLGNLQTIVVPEWERQVKQKDEEITVLKGQLSDMQLKLNDMQSALPQWEQHVLEKDKEINMLRCQLGDQENQISELLGTMVPEWERKVQQKDDELNVMRSQLTQVQTKLEEMRSTFTLETEEKLSQKEEEINTLRNEITLLETQLGDLRTNIVPQWEQQVNQKDEEIKRLTNSLQDTREKIEGLNNTLLENAGKIEESKNTAEQFYQQYEDAMQKVLRLEKELADKGTEQTQGSEKLSSLEEELSLRENKIYELEVQLAELQIETDDLKAQVSDAEATGNETAEQKMKIEELNCTVKTLQDMVDRLNEENTRLKTEMVNLTPKTAVNEAIESSNATVARLEQLTASMETEKHQLTLMIKDKAEEVNLLVSEKDRLVAEMKLLQEGQTQSLFVISELEDRIKMLEEQLASKEENMRALVVQAQMEQPPVESRVVDESEVDMLEHKIELLQGKLSEIECSEIKTFEESILLKSWSRELEQSNMKLQMEMDKILKSLSDGDGNSVKVKALGDQILSLVNSLHERDAQCCQLTVQITQLMEERDALALKLGRIDDQEDDHRTDDLISELEEEEDIRKRLLKLEEANFNLTVDLNREKQARRIVQEQLVFAQSSKASQNLASALASPNVRSPLPRVMSPSQTFASPNKSVLFSPSRTRKMSGSSVSSAFGSPSIRSKSPEAIDHPEGDAQAQQKSGDATELTFFQ